MDLLWNHSGSFLFYPLALLVGFFLLGVYSQVAQGLLIRETLVAFYGNEITVGIFYASWLWWTRPRSPLKR